MGRAWLVRAAAGMILGLGALTQTNDPAYCQGPEPGCPVINTKGWPKGKVVKYRLDGLNAVTIVSGNDAKNLATQAFQRWTTVNQSNDSGVRFEPAAPGEAANITFNVATSPIVNSGRQVRGEVMLFGEPTYTSAVIKMDLNNEGTPRLTECTRGGANYGPCSFWDVDSPNFNEAVIKTIMHEIGHTMGLENVDNPVQGKSIMSGAFSPNDCIRTSALVPCYSVRPPVADVPTPCDIAAINSRYTPLPPPPPDPGGGNDPPPPPPENPPTIPDLDWDNDGYDREPYGFDCNDWTPLIRPGLTTEEKCEAFHYYGGQVYDVDCDGFGDYDDCVSTGFRILADLWADAPQDQVPEGGGSTIVSFAADNGQFMVAEGGGGDVVNANRDWSGPWEKFALVDHNGGTLNDGDPVSFRTDNGQYLQAENGGGGAMLGAGGGAWAWETFTLINLSHGGVVLSGDSIALQSVSGHYVGAEGGGGQEVTASATGIGAWEAFRIDIVGGGGTGGSGSGRYKCGSSGCYWDPNDGGPDQCDPNVGCEEPPTAPESSDFSNLSLGLVAGQMVFALLTVRRRSRTRGAT